MGLSSTMRCPGDVRQGVPGSFGRFRNGPFQHVFYPQPRDFTRAFPRFPWGSKFVLGVVRPCKKAPILRPRLLSKGTAFNRSRSILPYPVAFVNINLSWIDSTGSSSNPEYLSRKVPTPYSLSTAMASLAMFMSSNLNLKVSPVGSCEISIVAHSNLSLGSYVTYRTLALTL